MIPGLLLIALLAAIGAPTTAVAPVYGPAEAIAAADARPDIGARGRFEMIVASASKPHRITFLNSAADFRSPDNLSFSLSPAVAKMLGRRLGGAPDKVLLGKHVVVDGTVRREMVANSVAGMPRGIARWQHNVRIEQVVQFVAYD